MCGNIRYAQLKHRVFLLKWHVFFFLKEIVIMYCYRLLSRIDGIVAELIIFEQCPLWIC